MPGFLRTLSLRLLSGKSKMITREPLKIGYTAAKKVAILFDLKTIAEINLAGEIEKNLTGDGKEVFKVFYAARKQLVSLIENSDNTLILTKNPFNLFQIPSNQILKTLQERKFDLVIDMSLSDCIPLIASASLSGTKLIAGIKSKTKEMYYDFMIDTEGESQADFHYHMFHYLKTINPHHNE